MHETKLISKSHDWYASISCWTEIGSIIFHFYSIFFVDYIISAPKYDITKWHIIQSFQSRIFKYYFFIYTQIFSRLISKKDVNNWCFVSRFHWIINEVYLKILIPPQILKYYPNIFFRRISISSENIHKT